MLLIIALFGCAPGYLVIADDGGYDPVETISPGQPVDFPFTVENVGDGVAHLNAIFVTLIVDAGDDWVYDVAPQLITENNGTFPGMASDTLEGEDTWYVDTSWYSGGCIGEVSSNMDTIAFDGLTSQEFIYRLSDTSGIPPTGFAIELGGILWANTEDCHDDVTAHKGVVVTVRE